MPSPITQFKCNFCRKHYSTNKDAKKHEDKCYFNPASKSCSTCNNTNNSDKEPYCLRLDKPIYIPGCGIRNCEGWEKIEYGDYDTGDYQ